MLAAPFSHVSKSQPFLHRFLCFFLSFFHWLSHVTHIFHTPIFTPFLPHFTPFLPHFTQCYQPEKKKLFEVRPIHSDIFNPKFIPLPIHTPKKIVFLFKRFLPLLLDVFFFSWIFGVNFPIFHMKIGVMENIKNRKGVLHLLYAHCLWWIKKKSKRDSNKKMLNKREKIQ